MTEKTIVYRVIGRTPIISGSGVVTIPKENGVYRSGMAAKAADMYNKWWSKNVKSASFSEVNFRYQTCPTPSDDEKLNFVLSPETPSFEHYAHYFFGFESLSQYREYFKSEKYRECLRDCGAYMTEYSVDNKYVRFGDHQLIFIRKHAQLVTFYPLPV